jgi:outer membrane protein
MMKQLKFLLFAAILFAGIQTASAQAKVAHIDMQELAKDMPDMKNANAQLEKIRSTHETQVTTMINELKAKAKQYDAEAAQTTDAVNKTREQELGDMQNRIEQYRQTAGEDLNKKRQELFLPILDKIQAAIKKVAQAKGYQYVLDASQGGGILVADGPNLLADVKKELGF